MPTFQITGVHDLLRQLPSHPNTAQSLSSPTWCSLCGCFFLARTPLSFRTLMPCSAIADLFSCAGLNAASSLSNVSHRTLTKDSIHAGFFNPLKMNARMPSVVCWLSVRQYPFYAQWQVCTLLLPHVNLQMMDPYTVIFWFVGQAPHLYVIYVL